jgi:glycosyltransferase involved in cell wall biosynthesis
MVVQGFTGLLAVSEEGIAENLARIFEEPELLVGMGVAARERAKKEFSWEVVLERLLRIYRTTIEIGSGVDRLYLTYKLMRRLG